MSLFFDGLAAVVVMMLFSGSFIAAAENDVVDFSHDIRPILSEYCFFCHGPDQQQREVDLRLDTRSGLFDGRGRKKVVSPGSPDESLIIHRITSEDEDGRMPPINSGKQLDAEQINLIRRWIKQGAPWQQHWAYVPPRRHSVPRVGDGKWSVNWIDHFILSRLESENIPPSPEAGHGTLVRRLSYDLTGLPPSQDRVDRFIDADDEQIYQQVLDELLGSYHFGERMAMYWLDLVRYADTVGYHGDQDHNISPYRDYVIDAFNENLAFDQFTAEQLGGDLMSDAGIDQKIASGYNRLLQTSHEGGVQPKEYLTMYAADRVRNISAVWLGATLGCTQCHDHKYDPFTMKDFYSMAAFFADIDEADHFTKGGNSLPTPRTPEIEVLSKRQRLQLVELETQISLLISQIEDESGSPENRRVLKQKMDALQKRHDAIADDRRKTMITVSIQPRTTRLLPRGNWLDESGPIVEPAVPEILGELPTAGRRANRLDLARWLTDSEKGIGGLTARVFVNRLWYLFFGGGLAPALDDFGGQGESPVHPELLDNLALELVESGWDVKRVVKRIVMSRAYRQSSVASAGLVQYDPYNRLFARQSRFRLPAEMVRDTALAVSGLLVKDCGGPSVRPYQPAGYYRHLNFPVRKYKHHTDRRQWRRGLYVHWQRQFIHPALKAMDAPRREECTVQRPQSNTPLAALTLLNDSTFVEAARVFAERILTESGMGTDARLEFAFRQAVARLPDTRERELLTKLLEWSRIEYNKQPESARQLIGVGGAPVSSNFDPADVAAWTSVARAILNLHETITRN